jgi:ABC-type multidrug transport system fused ATPase/permease subunit
MSNWQIVLFEPARTVLSQVSIFLVNVLLVVIILIIGWLVSKLVRAIVTRALKAIKLDDLSDRIELDSLLEKGGITYSLSEMIGVICYWLGLLVTFAVAMNAVGLNFAVGVLNGVVAYIPHVIIAIFILIIGMFVATLLKNIIQVAANNAGLAQSKLFSKITEILVVVFAVIVALEQLKIGIRITELTLAIILGSVGLAFALAFGLGCRDLAERFISDLFEKMKSKK